MNSINKKRGVRAMPYKSTWIANTFLQRARDDGVTDVDQLKIQKLVYCLHGWNLATRGEPVVGEMYEAWPYGPVLSSLYHEFKGSGRKPISIYAQDIDPSTGEKNSLKIAESNTEFYEVFNRVWSSYKNYTGMQLSMLTHADGTPWVNSRERGDDYICDEEIKTHFIALTKNTVNE